jgi:hypothetical protein
MKLWPGWEGRKESLREELEAHLRMAIEERVERERAPWRHARQHCARWAMRR